MTELNVRTRRDCIYSSQKEFRVEVTEVIIVEMSLWYVVALGQPTIENQIGGKWRMLLRFGNVCLIKITVLVLKDL